MRRDMQKHESFTKRNINSRSSRWYSDSIASTKLKRASSAMITEAQRA